MWLCCVQAAAVDADDDDGSDFLLKDNGDDLDLRLERLEVRGGGGYASSL